MNSASVNIRDRTFEDHAQSSFYPRGSYILTEKDTNKTNQKYNFGDWSSAMMRITQGSNNIQREGVETT